MDRADFEKVHLFIKDLMQKVERPPQGLFKYPSLATTAGECYAGGMFTWDTHHMTLRFAMAGRPEMMKYFLLTMLGFQRSDGFVACVCSSTDGPSCTYGFHAQPYLAQNAAIYLDQTGDRETVGEIFEKLEKYLNYYFNNCSAPFGLFRWNETWMSGFDNEIAGTIFPTGTILPPDLPSLLHLECRAMGFIARKLQKIQSAEAYEKRAADIKEAVNAMLWDERMDIYSARNLVSGKIQSSWNDGNLSSSIGKYAYISCPSFLTLYSGTAEAERAEKMIEKYILSPEHFRSKFGIRSLSRSSEYYNNARWGNPPRFGEWWRLTNSNWQGPVWIPLNWFVFHGLLRYGYVREAEQLADDILKLIRNSIDTLGFMRENYSAESGEGLYADHFASWNLLTDMFHSYLDNKGMDIFPWEKSDAAVQ